MAITRTAMVDDDGSGTTGTIINNAWKTELYNQIDAADAALGSMTTGTWLPRLSGDGSVAAGQTYNVQDAQWTRIGKLVFISGRMMLSAKGSISGAKMFIGGLPVPAAGTFNGSGNVSISYFGGFGGPIVHLAGYVEASTARIALTYTATAAVGVADIPASLITDTTDMQFGGFYLVA